MLWQRRRQRRRWQRRSQQRSAANPKKKARKRAFFFWDSFLSYCKKNDRIVPMFSVFQRLFGDENRAAYDAAVPVVSAAQSYADAYKAMSLDEIQAKTALFKQRIASGESLEALMPEAFALVREASDRVLTQRHFDVQLIGGAVLHNGDIAEMRTGEGKTLVATLPAYLNALTGKGVHVVTVNDYLSRRDAVWMGQVYHALGLTVGVINHEKSYIYDPAHVPAGESEKDDVIRDTEGSFKIVEDFLRPCNRKEAYEADITYGTNSEFGFDYLRDNIEQDARRLRQRGHNFAIVDEIDSILIDEARTPLIISAPVSDAERLYEKFASIAKTMVKDEDFSVDEKHRQVIILDQGISKAEQALGVADLYTDANVKLVHHLETAVRARALFERDKDYVVRDGQVVIVDEFTGRMQPGRRWSEGLHQAMEAKEHVAIQQESRTFASITYQNYFRLYTKLAGMTGTAKTSSEEFYKVYGLNTVTIPTNNVPQRIDHDDLIFQTERGKFRAIAKKVKELHEKNQPVLVGTASVEKNELLSTYFTQEGVPHQVLNAKNHEREGEIIAQAGRPGAVTIATNMAGRGVDIKLGGNPAGEGDEVLVRDAGGLFVLGTERHEARRIDNQLRGRAGRQGDKGETQFFVSLEDSLMRVFASDAVKKMMGTFGIPEDEPIQSGMITRALEKAQTRIEEIHFDARKHVLAYDDVLSAQRTSVYTLRRSILVGDASTVDAQLKDVVQSHPELESSIEIKKKEFGEEAFYVAIRRLMLQTIDLLWVDHLEAMDHLRSSVNLRAYGQRDPLVEYKKEGLRMFTTLQVSYKEHVARVLPHLVHQQPVVASAAAAAVEKAASALVGAGEAEVSSGNATYNRNDKVTITNGVETKEVKYKKAEELLKSGWKIV
jgi:preprotein translocase subunit SecA